MSKGKAKQKGWQINMLQGEEVKKYFNAHPEYAKKLEGIEYTDGEIYRPLTVEDIRFITFNGWDGEKGVLAWYFSLGEPHYCKIAN